MAKQIKKKEPVKTEPKKKEVAIRMLRDVKYMDTYLCMNKEYDIELRTAHTLVEHGKAEYV